MKIAVVIPCFNEEKTIGVVIQEIQEYCPDALIYVCDNGSTDRTREIAEKNGAIILFEPLKGKGYALRRMFRDIEADVYVLIDGDDTYSASSAPHLIKRLIDGRLDMVTGTRISPTEGAYRPGHQFGNVLLTAIVRFFFGHRATDMLSGYRVLSRRFVKSFPMLTRGFEVETELTVHALDLDMPIEEVETKYKERPAGSHSKLNTYYDGIRILKTIIILIKEERPLLFFSAIFSIFVTISITLGVPIIVEYFETGLVPRFPTAILATGIMLLGFLSLVCGLILDTVTRGRRELKRLWYLSIPAPGPNLE